MAGMKPEPPRTLYAKLRRVVMAAHYSQCGFRSVYRTEAAFRDEVWLSVFSMVLAACLAPSITIFLVVVAAHLIVFTAELLNSGIEAVVDLVSPGHHELAGQAKDAGSAAVFCSLVLLALAWIVLIIHR